MPAATEAAGAFSLAASTFALIFVNELADKSRVVGLLLAGTYRSRWPVFWGMTLAYAVLTAVAVLAGGWLHGSLSPRLIYLGAGLLFAGLGSAAFFLADEAEEGAKGWLERVKHWGPFAVSFVGTAAAEMGDRTQLASAGLSAESGHPFVVYGGALAALALLNLLTVLMGDWLSTRLNMALVNKGGGALFILLGCVLVYQGLALP
ncbi:MAG: TMEM165/GDT1 family protein [Elusimicrobia bacterium]|nr:TMEM165/GDT1 family protein [Elusimicrobiota bacterium]